MSQTDLGKLHQSEKEVDYAQMEDKHLAILERIKNTETEQTKMPSDSLNVNLQLGNKIEESGEYMEDPDNILARNPMGQYFRQKLKVTLSYQKAPGSITAGIFRNVQVDLDAPKGVQLEKKVFKFDQLTLTGSSTPPIEIFFVYAQKDMLPNDMKIEAIVTYQQVRDEKKAGGGSLLRTASNSITMSTSFFLRITEPNKDGLESKLMFSWNHQNSIGSLPNVFNEMFET